MDRGIGLSGAMHQCCEDMQHLICMTAFYQIRLIYCEATAAIVIQPEKLFSYCALYFMLFQTLSLTCAKSNIRHLLLQRSL